MEKNFGLYVTLLPKGKIKRDLTGPASKVSLENTTIQDELILFSELSFGPYAQVVDMIRTSVAFLCMGNDKVMGFDCLASRPGDNGARWDAIIVDNERSIPIEIKSPTEEQHLSVKAIRQALENKIILLSRRTHPTTPETTSLSVGYYMPNDRAEVSQLISSIKTTYGFKIGVMDLKSLLSLAVSILVDETGFDREKLYGLEGLMHADI